jgi:hypothetical protein
MASTWRRWGRSSTPRSANRASSDGDAAHIARNIRRSILLMVALAPSRSADALVDPDCCAVPSLMVLGLALIAS